MKKRLMATTTLAMMLALAAVGVAAQTGQVTGVVKEKCGQSRPDDLRVQLVDGQGVAVPGMTTAVAPDGTFAFTNVAPGMYTVQLIGATGMTAVTVIAGRPSVANVTFGTGKCAGFLKNKTTLLIVGAAAVAGTVVIIATRGEASASR